MYPRSVARLADASTKHRFDEAYEDKKRPIGWGEQHRNAVGLVQLYLLQLKFPMRKSIVREDGGRILAPDGKFASETYNAVVAFQKDVDLKQDGMVGPKTFDAMALILDPPRTSSRGFVQQIIVPPHHSSRPCPPGALICPDHW